MSGALSSIKDKASAGINRAKSAVGIQGSASQDSNANSNALADEMADMCPKLTYQQRMIGFISCFFLGYLITFMSFNFFIDLIEGRPVPFVMIYSKFKLVHKERVIPVHSCMHSSAETHTRLTFASSSYQTQQLETSSLYSPQCSSAAPVDVSFLRISLCIYNTYFIKLKGLVSNDQMFRFPSLPIEFKNMFDKKRKVVTIVYLTTLLISIIICFIKFNKDVKLLILVILLIVQLCASIWYSLSYIPFARRAAKKCFKNSFGGDEAV